jgi:hypothetical protein
VRHLPVPSSPPLPGGGHIWPALPTLTGTVKTLYAIDCNHASR